MRRREFLRHAGCIVVSAAAMPWLGCGDDDADRAQTGELTFPQGVASGDPQPTSVMLWTRAVPASGEGPVALVLEVSESEDLSDPVVRQPLEAASDDDFTVRIFVEDLSPGRIYYYRFSGSGSESRVGRTRTAPEVDADVEPRFVWASCQDYASNFYGAWRRLLNDDRAASEDEQLHFVLYVGDFIYETRGADFMQSVNDDLEGVALESSAGVPRVIPPFPSDPAAEFATTLEDYRHLYKHYLNDPDLQDARARWPFIQVWDDHEFTNDCWQTQSNYTNESTTDEPSQRRRLAASRAWFEFVPAALSDAKAVSGTEQLAKDFSPVDVEDAPYDEVIEVTEPNNVAALSAITIYRNFRWGRHLELVLTDNRSYRSDHPLPEEVAEENFLIFDPRIALPKIAIDTMDAGRDANGGDPPAVVADLRNTRRESPPGTILGREQKAWWKSVMSASTATFKVWGNSLPLLRFLLDRRAVATLLPNDLLLSDDAWDGYNTERKELMAYLRDENIVNVVSLSGDHHAHFAGVVHDDYDADEPTPIMVDFATAGISSNSQWSSVAAVLAAGFDPVLAPLIEPVKHLIVYDSTELGGSTKAVPNLNTLILYGSEAASVAAETHDQAQIEAARDPAINAHLRYADAHAFGFGIAHVRADTLEATLVSVERAFTDQGDKSPELRGTAKFTVPRVDQIGDLVLEEPELTGKKPFPLEVS
ncbi:MAG: alkaline phosphatase D family protein [Polyangiales bacterium]